MAASSSKSAAPRLLSADDLLAAYARDGVPPLTRAADVLAVLDAVPPSAQMATVAVALQARALTPAQRVALLVVWTRLGSWLTAQTDQAIVAVSGPVEVERADWGRDEAALAMRMSPQMAASRVFEARQRRGRLSRVGDALATGRLLPGQADDAVAEFALVGPDVVDPVCDRVFPRAAEQTRAQFRVALRRTVIAADPAAAAARHERAKKEDSGVWLRPLPDGLAELIVRTTAVGAVTVIRGLDAHAARSIADYKAALQADPEGVTGECPRMGMARVEALIGWAQQALADPTLPRAHGRRTEIGLTMTLATALGTADEPAHLEGYGPVCANVAREMLGEGTLRRLVTDPLSGELLDFGRKTYKPPQHLADFVITRAGRCIVRGCSRPARLCDLDHRVPFDRGPTSADNLDPLCQRHHIMKTKGNWQLLRDPNGELCWISAAGVRYAVHRDPVDPAHFDTSHPVVDYEEPPAALLERATAHLREWTAEQATRLARREAEPPF